MFMSKRELKTAVSWENRCAHYFTSFLAFLVAFSSSSSSLATLVIVSVAGAVIGKSGGRGRLQFPPFGASLKQHLE